MKEDTLSRRIVITFVIVLAILFLLAAIGYLLGRWDDASAKEPEFKYALQSVPVEKDEEHILALDREALDIAYKDHIKLVFGVWMKDPNDPNAPSRAGNGARNARKGYVISREKIEERERRLKATKPQ
jgi:hypothetical protein